MNIRTDLRLALPSKGRLETDSVQLLESCGLKIHKPNPRQYQASIPAIPSVLVLFQRPADIVVGVRQGSLDFAIAGLDTIEERKGDDGEIVIIHNALGFGHCSLALAVPESWSEVRSIKDLAEQALVRKQEGRLLRVATKYPVLTKQFLESQSIDAQLIAAEGTLEVAPSIGYADLICDLVSSGMTLHDNRLRLLEGGQIMRSQACLIANRDSLKTRPQVLSVARELLELFEAHLRAKENYLVFANMRGDSPESIAEQIFTKTRLGGLQGPTISRVIARQGGQEQKGRQDQIENWYDVNVVVPKDQIMRSVKELRSIGGSGVVVSPVSYIFEEEPKRYVELLKTLGQ